MSSKYTRVPKTQTPQFSEHPDIQNPRFLYVCSSGKTHLRNSKTPSYSSRIQIGAYPDPNFSKLLPKDLSFNKERLLEENSSFKAKASDICEENLRLKTKLCELMKEQDQDSTKMLTKMKKKIRDLQNEAISKDDELLELQQNVKSSKIHEYYNEIDSYIKEACRLKFLIERIVSNETPMTLTDFHSTSSHLAVEVQSLKKENIHLTQSKFQAEHDLQSLESKLSKLEHKRSEEKLKKKMKKFSKILSEKQKSYQDQSLVLRSKQEDLENLLDVERKTNLNKLNELEKNEKRIQQQDLLINEMKEKMDKDKIIRSRRHQTFMPSAIRENLEIKLMNPPRLLVKLNQILKKKKMLVSVLLSLLDTNNNGQVHHSTFITVAKSYGKVMKQKHLDEINKILSTDSRYIDLNKLEELYERYKYEESYKSSSDEEVKNVRKPQTASPASPSSPKLPEEKKSVPKPVLILQPVPEKKEKKVAMLKVDQISHLFEIIRSQMVQKKMHKGKLAGFLFGNNFDPDEQLSITEVERLLKENCKFEGLNELARYLVEPECIEMKESEYLKLKECLRNGCRKVLRHLPEWEVFTDEENEEFSKVLKSNLTVKYQKLTRFCMKIAESRVKFEEFIEALKAAEIFLADRMVTWLMIKLGLKTKEELMDYEEFLKEYQVIEPVFVVKNEEFVQKMEAKPGFSVEKFVETVAGVLLSNNSLFPTGFLSFDSDKFLEFIHSLPITVANEDLLIALSTFSEASAEKFTKKFAPGKFLAALEEKGFVPIADECYSSDSQAVSEYFQDDFEVVEEKKSDSGYFEENFESIDENSAINDEVIESFEERSESKVEEGKKIPADNETSLEFEEYGISFQ